MRTLIQHSKGRTARQVHQDLPGLYEDELTRHGFDGRSAVLYREKEPSAFRSTGRFRPTAIRAADCRTEDMDDPAGDPRRLFYNQDVSIYLSRRGAPMPWLRRNVDGDECWFVHRGEGHVDTEFGPIEFEAGDYVVIPKAVTHRWVTRSEDCVFMVIETVDELRAPTYVGLGRHAPFDPEVLKVPEPKVFESVEPEYEIRVKYDGEYSSIFVPHHPFDVAGWKGDYFPFAFNIRDWNVIMSDSLHLPPSMHVFLVAEGVNIINLLPRPFETRPGAERLPFYHRNADYDEITLFHGGDVLGRELDAGLLTHDPQGIHHGFPTRVRDKAIREWDRHHRIGWELIMVETARPLKTDPGDHLEIR